MTAIYRCPGCKYAGVKQCSCGNAEVHFMSPKWRIPKRNNSLAWKRIAAGELWWDRKAVAKKAKDKAESIKRTLDYLKRKNK